MRTRWVVLILSVVVILSLTSGCLGAITPTPCRMVEWDADASRLDAVCDWIGEHYAVDLPLLPREWPSQPAMLATSGEEHSDGEWIINFDPVFANREMPGRQRIIVANQRTGFRWEGVVEAKVITTPSGCDVGVRSQVTETSVTMGSSGQ